MVGNRKGSFPRTPKSIVSSTHVHHGGSIYTGTRLWSLIIILSLWRWNECCGNKLMFYWDIYLRQPILQLTINHVNNTDEIVNNKIVQKRRLLYKRERLKTDFVLTLIDSRQRSSSTTHFPRLFVFFCSLASSPPNILIPNSLPNHSDQN